MSKGIVHVVTRVTALPGKEEQIKTILLELMEPTRQEPGCISYKLLHSRVIPRDFVLMSEWESEEYVDQHLDSVHVQEAFLEGGRLLASPPDIRRYQLLA